ncbi:MAG TPA: biotin--[acetyl-CoA-carboxylase] ligase [Holophagaceae bacterium]|nr:biotin--[acetyl-CoA-carboxylase] ligase [Holophagaceae bacterium]
MSPRASGVPLLRLAEVDSTQAFLRRHPELGFCAVMADSQTEGRGRQGHRWESAPGAGLWLSAALPPPDLPPGIVLQRAMAAVIEALRPFGAELGLKWPNDLVAWKGGDLVKVGGILGERTGGRLIVGLGVNLSAAPDLPDRAIPASSLLDLGARVPEPISLAVAIIYQWQDLQRELQPFFRWPEEGAALRWEGGQGVCLGWEEDGRLKVTTASGIQRLSAGEVRGLFG